MFDQKHDFNAEWTTPAKLEPIIETLSQLIHNCTTPDAPFDLAPVVPFSPILLELLGIVTSPDRQGQDCSVMWALIMSLLIKVWALMIYWFFVVVVVVVVFFFFFKPHASMYFQKKKQKKKPQLYQLNSTRLDLFTPLATFEISL